MFTKSINFLLVLIFLLAGFACKTKDDLDAFREAKYSLERVDQVKVNGVELMDKKRPEDFSFSDAALLLSALSDNKLKATSTLGLNVELGEGNEDRTMTVTELKWQLLLDNEKALSGVVNEPVELKHGLNVLTLSSPLAFSEERGGASLNNILKLATVLNKEENRPQVTLQIKPTILTSVGPFELPAFINIKK
ncbi:hypothetical protein ACFSRY_15490 [Pontibacter locisalis]|uniref:Late embryogenesis abundant protein n=1 Tax=Pontibacter locisalis TaxID=1719035 RepID=A0ABW5IQS8_9BACT